MKHLLISIFIFSFTFSAFAQERFDLFYIAGNYNFMQTSAADLDKNFETTIMAQVRVPIVFKNKSIWFTQLDYHYFDVDNEYITTSSLERMKLHGFIFRTGYIYQMNEKQSIQALFAPRLMTDFNASFAESIQLGGILMYEKIKNENLTWKVGVLYNQDFFGPYIVPVVDLNWSITNTLKLKGLIPVYGALFLEPSEKIQYGLHFIGLTTSYKFSEPAYVNYYVDRRSIDVSLFSKIHLFNNFFLTARAGYSLTRDYGLFGDDDKMTLGLPLVNIGDDRIRANNEYDGSPFVHLRMIYSIPIE